MTRICFVAAGPLEWGSSRMRAYWPAEAMEADVVRIGQRLPVADVYIWQKAVDLQFIRTSAALHIWDVCDPFHWFDPATSRQVAEAVGGIVASSEALARDLRHWTPAPVEFVPDTINPLHFTDRRRHADVTPLRFIWYGVHVNRVALAGAWANLTRLAANGHAVELTVFDDRPDLRLAFGDEIRISYAPWSLGHEAAMLAAHDVALLPPYPGPWGRVKSDNKRMTATWAGLPVTDGHDYEALLELLEPDARREAVAAQRSYYDYRTNDYAAERWQEVIDRWI